VRAECVMPVPGMNGEFRVLIRHPTPENRHWALGHSALEIPQGREAHGTVRPSPGWAWQLKHSPQISSKYTKGHLQIMEPKIPVLL